MPPNLTRNGTIGAKGMVEFALRRAGRLALGLFGACLLASVLAALAAPHAPSDTLFSIWFLHLGHVLRLDFGASPASHATAAADLARRLPVTLSLIGSGAVVALIMGVPLGFVLGGGPRFRAAVPVAQTIASVPVFCGALLLLWLADRLLGWQGGRELGALVWSAGHRPDALTLIRGLALPVLTVGAAGAAATQVLVRDAVSTARGAPYRRGLRLMGLSGLETDAAYFLPQIASGVMAGLGQIALALLSAAAVAEFVFGWPGAAVLFVDAVARHAWDAAALVLLVFAAIALAADFAGAVCARVLTPSKVLP